MQIRTRIRRIESGTAAATFRHTLGGVIHADRCNAAKFPSFQNIVFVIIVAVNKNCEPSRPHQFCRNLLKHTASVLFHPDGATKLRSMTTEYWTGETRNSISLLVRLHAVESIRKNEDCEKDERLTSIFIPIGKVASPRYGPHLLNHCTSDGIAGARYGRDQQLTCQVVYDHTSVLAIIYCGNPFHD